ncbi:MULTISPECIES: hypothetical protein [unclassified Streptomyces]|uniref:hypothetical protein n=1 Tax=unclassified Streptomyces TaxID=2593676 RepID=UPI001BAF72B0|nr:hypothetical protein [Streptomyces sp. A2-16]QUC55421.1 hypothetical protein IOD14_00660 [Streptomyces sp. A2-16]
MNGTAVSNPRKTGREEPPSGGAGTQNAPPDAPAGTDGDRLRSAGRRPAVGGAPAGVRMTRPDDASPWHVEIHVVAVREARTVDVARAVRGSVERRLGALSSPRPAPRVTVTVTGLV